MRHAVLFAIATAILASSAGPAAQRDGVAEHARKLHFSSLVVDTHVDAPNLLKPDWKFSDEHTTDAVDLPRLRKGGLDAVFFSIFMEGTVKGPQAVNDAMERIAAVRKLAANLPGDVALCLSADDIRRANRAGKVAILMGMEGGHMINDSMPILRTYAELGIRYLTLTHNEDTDWADSVAGKAAHNGLTDFGKQVVLELNRLGVMVDISHVADKTFWDALATSQAPMIASHSSTRALASAPRNMTDDMIKALAGKGGVIQINYYTTFIQDQPAGGHVDVSWERILDHIDHAVKLVGADHVGLGSDFDGATMPIGMEDVSKLPKITEGLVRRHYSDADIRKILGENTLRLMRDVERVAATLNPPRKVH